jgi:hypothetical protein
MVTMSEVASTDRLENVIKTCTPRARVAGCRLVGKARNVCPVRLLFSRRFVPPLIG